MAQTPRFANRMIITMLAVVGGIRGSFCLQLEGSAGPLDPSLLVGPCMFGMSERHVMSCHVMSPPCLRKAARIIRLAHG